VGMKRLFGGAVAVGLLGAWGIAVAAPAQAVDCVKPGLLVNSAENDLLWVYPDGTQSIVGEFGGDIWGDIALSPDGQVAYGVRFGGFESNYIDVISLSDGSATELEMIGAGGFQPVLDWNAATIIADGSMLIGAAGSKEVYRVDLANPTAESTVAVSKFAYNVVASTAGDFAVADNGDVLWVLDNDGAILIARIPVGGAPDAGGTNQGLYPATVVAEIVLEDGSGLTLNAYGAGRVNDDIYFVEEGVHRLPLSVLPTIADAEAQGFVLPKLELVTVLEATEYDPLYGAAGTGDSGTQPPACSNGTSNAGNNPSSKDKSKPVPAVEEVVAAQEGLARTGSNMLGLAGLGALIVVTGGAALLATRARTAKS